MPETWDDPDRPVLGVVASRSIHRRVARSVGHTVHEPSNEESLAPPLCSCNQFRIAKDDKAFAYRDVNGTRLRGTMIPPPCTIRIADVRSSKLTFLSRWSLRESK